MFKSKVHFAFYKSLKSRLIFMIFVLVLVPEVVLCFGILNTYESRAVSIRESEVLSQAKILANKISTSKYFDKDGSDLSIDAQIDTLTTIYEGRVLIVDKHFKIIKDTYNLDDGNTIVSEEVIKTFSASEITNYDSKNHYIELSVPISNRQGFKDRGSTCCKCVDGQYIAKYVVSDTDCCDGCNYRRCGGALFWCACAFAPFCSD